MKEQRNARRREKVNFAIFGNFSFLIPLVPPLFLPLLLILLLAFLTVSLLLAYSKASRMIRRPIGP